MTDLRRTVVSLCHDNAVLQAGLLATLRGYAELDCIDAATTMETFDRAARPDVVIADHQRGISLARRVARLPPGLRTHVLVVTPSERECDIRAALASGVMGYLLLCDLPEHLVPAIRSLRQGEPVLGPRVASRLAENVAQERLTPRELAVLRLIVDGFCNKKAASALGITIGTVKSHLRSMFGKLGVTSRTQAMAIAQRRGLLHTEAGSALH